MGASIAEGGFDDDEEFAEAHEINVTPFIDVMLVLLIIFMVAAPLSTVDLPIDLPTSSAQPQKKPDKPVYVSIKPDLTVAIGERCSTRSGTSPWTRPPRAIRSGWCSCVPTVRSPMAT